MSTVNLIVSLESSNKIVRHRPDGNRKAKRCLFLSEAAAREYNNDQCAAILLAKRGPLKNALDHWVLGRCVWGRESRRIFTEGRFLKPLRPPPDHIWEIKITEPVVQVRLFGLFIERDMFLVTNFHTRGFLDQDDNWTKAMTESADQWSALFGNQKPHVGTTIGDYVSENYDDFPITTKAPRKKRAG